MKDIFKNVFLQNSLNWKFWILLSLIFKGFLFLFLIFKGDYNNISGFWGAVGGDTQSYLLPIENLVNLGNYEPDFRMPGYAFIYIPLLFVFSKIAALNLIIIIQYIFSALAVYFIAIIAKHIFKSDSIFYLTYYLALFSIYSNMSDHYILSESFATSFMVFLFYFFIQWIIKKRLFYLIISGFCLTEAIFFKSVFFPFFLIFLIVIVYYSYKNNKRYFINIMSFSLFFIILDGIWVIRNYHKYNTFLPVQTSFKYKDQDNGFAEHAVMFCKSWGGNSVSWDPKAEIRWFGITEHKREGIKPFTSINKNIPSSIYTSKFNRDSLLNLKIEIFKYNFDSKLTEIQKWEINNDLILKFDLYAKSIKSENPFLYYVKAPLSYLMLYFFHSGTTDLFNQPFSELNIFEKGVKMIYSFYYWIILIFGFIGIVLLLKNSILTGIKTMLIFFVFYMAFIYPFIFRMCEYRYFVPAWPFLLICASYFLHKMLTIIQKLTIIKKLLT